MSNIIKREFNGIEIAFEGKELVSLTDLWRASKKDRLSEPNRWLTDSGTCDFMLEIMKSIPEFNSTAQSHLENKPFGREEKRELELWCKDVFNSTARVGLLKTKRGKTGGGTWAHWQIGLAYAKHLSTELHMFVNQCFMDYIQEANNPGLKMDRAIDGYHRKGKDDSWIEARLKSKLTTKTRNSVLSQRQGGDGNIYAMCNTATNRAILGMDSSEFRAAKQLTKSALVRDHMTRRQLLEIALTEDVCSERILEANIIGNAACAQCHSVVGNRIHSATTTRGV